MTFGQREQARLYSQLLSCGYLPADWRPAYWRIPRHRFVPDALWERGADGGLVATTRADDPARWLRQVYANAPVITQVDDGATRPGERGRDITSSASMPSIVFSMLRHLNVHGDERVLEIGTGTGWNAGLLCARLGNERVTTIEVDPRLAGQAAAALHTAGLHPKVVAGDGGQGYEPNAPYDRIIATCAVQHVPRAWVEQTRPGGIILVPWGTPYGGDGLLRLVVGEDGTARGSFLSNDLSFMWINDQRAAYWSLEDDVPSPTHYDDEQLVDLWPGEWIGVRDAEFAIGLSVPGLRAMDVDDDGSPWAGAWWLFDPGSKSWASVLVEEPGESCRVRQQGSRRLFDEVAMAYRLWNEAGRPTYNRFEVVVSAGGEAVALDGRPVQFDKTPAG